MDQKLIETVKKYPCLWNTSLSTYKCNGTRDEAWEEIVKIIKYRNVQSAKVRWKQLRDCHRDALKRQKIKRTEHVGSKIREWKYQRHMEFLLPYMSNRDRETSQREDPRIVNEEESCSSQLSSNQGDAMSGDFSEFTSFQSTIKELVTSSQLSKKKTSNEISTLHQRQLKNAENLRKQRHHNYDEIDLFFLSIAKTIKKLPDYLQVSVKRKCFNFVSEAEESYMMQRCHQNMNYSNTFSKESNVTVKLENECLNVPLILSPPSLPPSGDAQQTTDTSN